jgi:hypothetical protein
MHCINNPTILALLAIVPGHAFLPTPRKNLLANKNAGKLNMVTGTTSGAEKSQVKGDFQVVDPL